MIGRATFAAGLLLCGCTHYEPRPLALATHPAEYHARRLEDSALVTYVTRHAGAPQQARWTDRQLAVAALRLRREPARARAQWTAARSGETAARARPQPGVQTDVERAVSDGGGQPPWVVAVGGLFTLELGGKRGARLQLARARTAAAEADLVLSAWRVNQETRAATVDVVLAESELEDARAEVEALERLHSVETQRFAEAAVGSSELARTAAEVQEGRSAAVSAERAVIAARAALAGALAVPPRAVDSLQPNVPPPLGCSWIREIGSDSAARLALRRRGEVARVLAEYAESEAELRLQVARQYPDLELGPGFIWDQGVERWTLSLVLPALLGFRNQGPIAQAEAARTAAALRVAEVQDSVLAELASATEKCRGTTLERVASDSQVAAAERGLELAQAAYQRGETSRLEASQAGLALLRARRLHNAVGRRAAIAALAVERAAGEWSGVPPTAWPDPRDDETAKEAGSR